MIRTQRQRRPPLFHHAGRAEFASARIPGCTQVPKIRCSSRANIRVMEELSAGLRRRSRMELAGRAMVAVGTELDVRQIGTKGSQIGQVGQARWVGRYQEGKLDKN